MPTKPPTSTQRDRGLKGRAAYDSVYQRDPKAAAFYSSREWRKVRAHYRVTNPLCEPCRDAGRTTAVAHVHHIVKVRDDASKALDYDNLMSVCAKCHAREERK